MSRVEDELGAPLFTRRGVTLEPWRGFEPADPGEAAVGRVEEAFAPLRSPGVGELRDPPTHRPLGHPAARVVAGGQRDVELAIERHAIGRVKLDLEAR